MYHGHITDESFVLASLKEFVKLWGSGSQASLQLDFEKEKLASSFPVSSELQLIYTLFRMLNKMLPMASLVNIFLITADIRDLLN